MPYFFCLIFAISNIEFSNPASISKFRHPFQHHLIFQSKPYCFLPILTFAISNFYIPSLFLLSSTFPIPASIFKLCLTFSNVTYFSYLLIFPILFFLTYFVYLCHNLSNFRFRFPNSTLFSNLNLTFSIPCLTITISKTFPSLSFLFVYAYFPIPILIPDPPHKSIDADNNAAPSLFLPYHSNSSIL